MANLWLALGAINAFISVGAGAFGAHGLRAKLTPELLTVFETGARYQMYHALALLALGLVARSSPSWATTASGALLMAGILLFSGSLYALALSGVRVLGAITPFGGLCFLAAWILFAYAALRS